MDKAKPLSNPMVGRSLNVDNDPFRPCEDDEEILSPNIPYLSLFYPNDSKEGLAGYADVSYLSDPHKARSQTGYMFLNRGTAISWRSQKQTLVATSSNHAEVIALHEASRECVWLSLCHCLLTSSFSSKIFKSLSFRLDRLCHLAILCLDQHAHTLHHLESLLTISLDRLDNFEGRSCISEFVPKSLSLILELSRFLNLDAYSISLYFKHAHVVMNSTLAGMRHHHLHLYVS
ncbi:secreted RxLR effector protein 161-like protein [Tanacetum coccineum]